MHKDGSVDYIHHAGEVGFAFGGGKDQEEFFFVLAFISAAGAVGGPGAAYVDESALAGLEAQFRFEVLVLYCLQVNTVERRRFVVQRACGFLQGLRGGEEAVQVVQERGKVGRLVRGWQGLRPL